MGNCYFPKTQNNGNHSLFRSSSVGLRLVCNSRFQTDTEADPSAQHFRQTNKKRVGRSLMLSLWSGCKESYFSVVSVLFTVGFSDGQMMRCCLWCSFSSSSPGVISLSRDALEKMDSCHDACTSLCVPATCFALSSSLLCPCVICQCLSEYLLGEIFKEWFGTCVSELMPFYGCPKSNVSFHCNYFLLALIDLSK